MQTTIRLSTSSGAPSACQGQERKPPRSPPDNFEHNGGVTAYLVDGVRTPMGKYGGALAGVRPDDLAALVIASVVERAGVPADSIDEVVFGAANQAGEDNRNVARMGALLAGLPDTLPGFTVNRLCASGLQAVVSAAQAVETGQA